MPLPRPHRDSLSHPPPCPHPPGLSQAEAADSHLHLCSANALMVLHAGRGMHAASVLRCVGEWTPVRIVNGTTRVKVSAVNALCSGHPNTMSPMCTFIRLHRS
jgi:hypothetical protein